ncbi:MAG: hypothetical protein KAT54_00860, partial [Candidatus Marinimicrobia bacterium]|nr:hypothetical protein [Candidatus Neomarinimicrobiota bacterium]
MFRNDETRFYTLVKQWLSLIVVIQLLPSILTADQITITGNYLDKKNNPITGASVRYFRQAALIDSTTTDGGGNFTLTLASMHTSNHAIMPSEFSLNQNYPNPFNPETRIQCGIIKPATLTLYNICGQFVDQIHLPTPGAYTILWGGADRFGKAVGAGIYILVLSDNEHKIVKRLTLLDSGNGSRMRIDNSHNTGKPQEPLKKLTTNDEIHFIKSNTTDKILHISPVSQDTSLGIIIGNVGPIVLDAIPDQVLSVGDTMLVDMDEFVYNDEAGLYLPRANFDVEDNLIKYVATHPETLSTIIDIIDRTDSDLRDSLLLRVYVPYANHPPVFTGNVPNYTIPQDSFLVINTGPLFQDVDNETLYIMIRNLVNASSRTIEDSMITVVPTQGWNGTITGLMLEAYDLGPTPAQSNLFDITVTPLSPVTVHFLLKDFYTDTTITADTSTFWVGDSIYQSLDGTLTLTLPRGSYEFNATNPNTIDGMILEREYLFLRRPGDTENFEQRAYQDYSSPIILSTENDTILAYKIMSDYPLYNAGLILDSEGNGTVRFG